jgi:hypothetical protein
MMLRWMRLLPMLATLAAPFAPSHGAADCKADLVASQRALKATRAAVEKVSLGSEAGSCEAYRKHLAAMTKFGEVLGRCDTGANRDAHAAQLTASIEEFRKKLPKRCKV